MKPRNQEVTEHERSTTEILIAYRMSELGYNDMPDDAPHDPEELAEVDAEFHNWLNEIRADAVREAANNLDQARTEVAGNKPDNPGWQYIAGGVKSAVIWLHRYADHHDRSKTSE